MMSNRLTFESASNNFTCATRPASNSLLASPWQTFIKISTLKSWLRSLVTVFTFKRSKYLQIVLASFNAEILRSNSYPVLGGASFALKAAGILGGASLTAAFTGADGLLVSTSSIAFFFFGFAATTGAAGASTLLLSPSSIPIFFFFGFAAATGAAGASSTLLLSTSSITIFFFFGFAATTGAAGASSTLLLSTSSITIFFFFGFAATTGAALLV